MMSLLTKYLKSHELQGNIAAKQNGQAKREKQVHNQRSQKTEARRRSQLPNLTGFKRLKKLHMKMKVKKA